MNVTNAKRIKSYFTFFFSSRCILWVLNIKMGSSYVLPGFGGRVWWLAAILP